MLHFLFQFWGGSFYLLNKFFFSRAERANSPHQQQKWRIGAWTAYLIGLPPWVLIFISERNWIAAAVETSGVPAMLIGLSVAWKGGRQAQKQIWLEYLAQEMIIIGVGLSFYDFGGLTRLNQFLELGIASGFLLGTYLLAKERAQGYFWLMVGNVSAASLMMRQGYFLLMTQQVLSLCLVFDAFWIQRLKINEKI